MRIESGGARRRPIGLTSLIDVIFLLLLFFMLASTFSRHQALPLGGGSASTAAARPALLRVQGAGRMDLNGAAVDAAALAARLADLAAGEVTAVAILATGRAEVQDVVTALEAVERAGLSGALVTGK